MWKEIGLMWIGFGTCIIALAVIFYLFALPFVNQAYKQAFLSGELVGKAQQNSTIANALIVATIECAFSHNDLLTTNGISNLTTNGMVENIT